MVTLDLERNHIIIIPASVKSLTKLEQLDLRGNPLDIPKDVLDSDAATRARLDRPANQPILNHYFTTLYNYYDKGQRTIECRESFEQVQVSRLIDDIIMEYPNEREMFDREYAPEHKGNLRGDRVRYRRRDRKSETPVINNEIHIHNQQETTMNESSKTNNFNAPMSGIIGSDNAQVSHNTFTQTNSASTEELLQLIATLRQTSANFPPETQAEIIPDLEDIEAEIIKPDRNPIKIRKRLVAIATAASLVAGGVANVTDFSNAAIDLGQKFDIDIPALVGR